MFVGTVVLLALTVGLALIIARHPRCASPPSRTEAPRADPLARRRIWGHGVLGLVLRARPLGNVSNRHFVLVRDRRSSYLECAKHQEACRIAARHSAHD